MRWKAKYTKTDYPHGSTRLKRVFSFLPVYIAGNMVWLENYEILQAYIIREHELEVEGEKAFFSIAEWTDISKRVIE